MLTQPTWRKVLLLLPAAETLPFLLRRIPLITGPPLAATQCRSLMKTRALHLACRRLAAARSRWRQEQGERRQEGRLLRRIQAMWGVDNSSSSTSLGAQ